MKILLLITTYKREDKLLRFLDRLSDEEFHRIKDTLDVLVADDDPTSTLLERIDEISRKHPLKVRYIKNEINLGQGPNGMNALTVHRDYDYYWIPGDDDEIIPGETVDLVKKILLHKPSVAVLEFRQGRGLSQGTFFEGESRLITDPEYSIEAITRFGKGTSAIFSRPSDWALKLVSESFFDCMYQDKALAILAYLESKERKIYLKTEMTAFGDEDFGKLRYSARVFVNLYRTRDLIIDFYKKKYNTQFSYSPKIIKVSVIDMWIYGIKNHFNPKSELSYTTSRLLKEIFVFPIKYIHRIVVGKHPKFEK